MTLVRSLGDYSIYWHPIRGRKVYAVSYQGTFIDDELPSFLAATQVADEHRREQESQS